MYRFLAILGIALHALTATASAETVRIANTVVIPVPEGWHLATDTLAFPAQLVYDDDGAELLIFQSPIDPSEVITDEEHLRGSVTQVETEVIGTLPDGTLLTSSGFVEGHRAGFTLEFLSTDTVSHMPLKHRLLGLIYRTAEDSQVLYTVWGKAGVDVYPFVEADIRAVQDGFVHMGPYESSVFGEKERPSLWMLLLLAMAVIGIFVFYRPGKKRRKSLVGTPGDHFWRCDCGRVNHESVVRCQRCGRDSQTAHTS